MFRVILPLASVLIHLAETNRGPTGNHETSENISRQGQNLRIKDGIDDIHNEFPYVVALCNKDPILRLKVRLYRICTGSLISERWVITAAHCALSRITRIRYGDMTVPPNDTKATFSNILRTIPHPAYQFDQNTQSGVWYVKTRNDIALMLVEKVPMAKYGKVSAVEYTTMIGHAVRYAGFGTTHRTNAKVIELIETMKKDEARRLQLGEAVVVPCTKHKGSETSGPHICLAAKCGRRKQVSRGGDSGGPLFHAGRIAGVLFGGYTEYSNQYTPGTQDQHGNEQERIQGRFASLNFFSNSS